MQSQSIELSTFPDGRLDPKNASLYLGVSEKTLAMWRCKGLGPTYVQPSRRVYYFKEDLDAWMNKHGKVVSTAQSRFKRDA